MASTPTSTVVVGATRPGPNGPLDAAIFSFDAGGNLGWQKIVGTGGSPTLKNVVWVPPNDLLVFGQGAGGLLVLRLDAASGSFIEAWTHQPPGGVLSGSPDAVLPSGSAAVCSAEFNAPASACVIMQPGLLTTGCTSAGQDVPVPMGNIPVVDGTLTVQSMTYPVGSVSTQSASPSYSCVPSSVPTGDACN